MHQGWMSRIQAKNVFSHCCGTNWVRPCVTASIAGCASTAALQYHCTVSSGSIGTPERSPCGTWWVCGSTAASRPRESSAATMAARAAKRSCPARPRTKPGSAMPGTGCNWSSISASDTWAARSSTEGMGSPCRWPTAKSLKSCAGVILTAPVPFSGSE